MQLIRFFNRYPYSAAQVMQLCKLKVLAFNHQPTCVVKFCSEGLDVPWYSDCTECCGRSDFALEDIIQIGAVVPP